MAPMDTVTLLLAAALVAAGAVAVAALMHGGRSRRDAQSLNAEIVRMAETVAAGQNDLAGRLAQITETSAAGQATLAKTLNERLDAVSKRLGETLDKSADKTTKTIIDLRERLARIDAAQKNIAELSGQVVSLQEVLSNKQARGAFGEIQLNDLVGNVLPPSGYRFQATLGNGRRCDCLIDLPNPPGPIAIDAKFPLESYHALRNADDDDARTVAGRAFRAAMHKHIDDISSRYIVPGETAESAMMFLPSEAVYGELHANFAEVVEKSYRAKVFIVSPTSLWAVLNTMRAVMKDVHMRDQAGFIQTEVMALLDDILRLEKRVENLQKHFGLAEKDIREIEISTGKIVRKASLIGEVQIEGDAPAETIEGPRLVDADGQPAGE